MGLGIEQVLGKAAHSTILQREVVKEAGRSISPGGTRASPVASGIRPTIHSWLKEVREGGQNTASAPLNPRSLAPWAGPQSEFCLC